MQQLEKVCQNLPPKKTSQRFELFNMQIDIGEHPTICWISGLRKFYWGRVRTPRFAWNLVHRWYLMRWSRICQKRKRIFHRFRDIYVKFAWHWNFQRVGGRPLNLPDTETLSVLQVSGQSRGSPLPYWNFLKCNVAEFWLWISRKWWYFF